MQTPRREAGGGVAPSITAPAAARLPRGRGCPRRGPATRPARIGRPGRPTTPGGGCPGPSTPRKPVVPWLLWRPGRRRTGRCAPSPRAGSTAPPAATRRGSAARCRTKRPNARPPSQAPKSTATRASPCTEKGPRSRPGPRWRGRRRGPTPFAPASGGRRRAPPTCARSPAHQGAFAFPRSRRRLLERTARGGDAGPPLRSAAARDVTRGGASGSVGRDQGREPLVAPLTLGEALTGQRFRPIAVRPVAAARLGWRLRRLQLQVGELWGLREEWDGSASFWGPREGGDPRGSSRPCQPSVCAAGRAAGLSAAERAPHGAPGLPCSPPRAPRREGG